MKKKHLLLFTLFTVGTLTHVFSQFQIQKNNIPLQKAAMLNDETTLLGYNIYRNNIKLNTEIVAELVFLDTVPDNGTFNYYVTALYEEGESGSSNVVEVLIDQNATTREYVVFEEGTGTWCVYCPAAANGYEDLVAAGKKVVGIAYHSGSFDSYGNSDATARLDYYRISNFPTAVFDGIEKVAGGGTASESNYDLYLPVVEQRMEVSTAFIMGVNGTISEDSYTAKVTIEKVAINSSTDLRLIGVLVESHIDEEWMGMTELNEVARDVMPTATGQSINFDTTNQQSVNLTFAIEDSWEKSNCKLIVFVQDYQTQEIFQATEIEIDDFASKTKYAKSAKLETLFAPYDLSAEYNLDSPAVRLTWKTPGDLRWMEWDDGTNASSIGSGSKPINFDVAARWDTSDLAPLKGMMISKMAFFPKEATCTYTAKIWEGETDEYIIVDSLLESVTAKEWNEVVLKNKIMIDVSKELWVGYNNNNSYSKYSAGIDAGPAIVGKGDKIRFNEDGIFQPWWNISEGGVSGNWNIKVYVEPFIEEPSDTTAVFDLVKPQISLYPNPANGMITIESDVNITALYVISVNGQVVSEAKPSNQKYTLNINRFKAGIYFVKVVSAKGYSFEKLIIE